MLPTWLSWVRFCLYTSFKPKAYYKMDAIRWRENSNEKCRTIKAAFTLSKFREKTSLNMLERAILSVLAIATLNFVIFMCITQSQCKLWSGCYNIDGKFKWEMSHNQSVIYIIKVYCDSPSTYAHNNSDCTFLSYHKFCYVCVHHSNPRLTTRWML